MSKLGRIACIFTPMALTIASFICLVLLELGGWNTSSTTLNSFYFFQANFSGLDVTKGGSNAELTAALTLAQTTNSLRDIYQIHLWNYCTANTSTAPVDWCSPRQANYVFDPVEVWALNATDAAEASATANGNTAAASEIAELKNNTEQLEETLLGESGKKALDAYRKVAKWMFISYEISFWTTLATIIFGVLAIFSRWGSFITWALAFISTLFTTMSALTSTILFAILVGALKTLLDPYSISLSLSTSSLTVVWLSVAFSWAATLFWLFSVCCCSGKSNPHHRGNKGGLWNAGSDSNEKYGRGRGLRVEKTGGGGYQRVGSPFMGHGHSDSVPLQEYAQPQPYGGLAPGRGTAGYEPFRHG